MKLSGGEEVKIWWSVVIGVVLFVVFMLLLVWLFSPYAQPMEGGFFY